MEIKEKLQSEETLKLWDFESLEKKQKEIESHADGKGKQAMMQAFYDKVTMRMRVVAEAIFGSKSRKNTNRPYEGNWKIKIWEKDKNQITQLLRTKGKKIMTKNYKIGIANIHIENKIKITDGQNETRQKVEKALKNIQKLLKNKRQKMKNKNIEQAAKKKNDAFKNGTREFTKMVKGNDTQYNVEWESGEGYKFKNNEKLNISNITYVDDNTLISDTEKGMKRLQTTIKYGKIMKMEDGH